jgi:hypothetical protein
VLTTIASLSVCPHPVAVCAHKITLQRFCKESRVRNALELTKTKTFLNWVSVVKVVHEGRSLVAAVDTLAAMVFHKLALSISSPSDDGL